MDGNTYISLLMPTGMLSGLPMAAGVIATLGLAALFIVMSMAGRSPPMTKRWRK